MDLRLVSIQPQLNLFLIIMENKMTTFLRMYCCHLGPLIVSSITHLCSMFIVRWKFVETKHQAHSLLFAVHRFSWVFHKRIFLVVNRVLWKRDVSDSCWYWINGIIQTSVLFPEVWNWKMMNVIDWLHIKWKERK